MNQSSFRFRAFLGAAVVAAGLLPFVAHAKTTTWAWSDISNRVSIRRDRPVWALAQAKNVAFYTDGLDLSRGGHVWRTDGSTADITKQIRNAGLTRVDDIVSNGSIVLFLQNVASADNSFSIVSFDGTSFVNRTGRLRGWFDADEGIASVQGSDTEWAFVTTKGKIRIFGNLDNIRSRPEATSGQEPATPVSDIGPFVSGLDYSFRHTSPSDRRVDLPESVVPYNGGWLIAYRTQGDTVSFLSYSTRTGFLDMGDAIQNIRRVHAIASNGMSVLLAGSSTDGARTDRVLLLEQGHITDLSGPAASLPFSNWNRTIIGSSGTSWMILNEKHLVRLQDGAFQSLGKTRDYFLNIAGSSNGSFFLGGVVSDQAHDDVPAKLTAKLVNVLEK